MDTGAWRQLGSSDLSLPFTLQQVPVLRVCWVGPQFRTNRSRLPSGVAGTVPGALTTWWGWCFFHFLEKETKALKLPSKQPHG